MGKRRWQMRQLDRMPYRVAGCAASELFVGRDIAREAWGDGADTPDFPALSYLFRRFGPPLYGSDDHKCFCDYRLTTPDPDVILCLTLKGTPLSYSVHEMHNAAWDEADAEIFRKWENAFAGWWVEQSPDWQTWEKEEASKRFAADCFSSEVVKRAAASIGEFPTAERRAWSRSEASWREGPERVKRLNGAIFEACQELLRPVFVRDVAINILGHVPDKAVRRDVQPSKYAGYGVPKAALDQLLKQATP